MKLSDLLRPGITYDVDLGPQIGDGGQGRVFLLARFGSSNGTHVLKLYAAPAASPDGRHLIDFTRHLDQHPKVRQERGLAVPLLVIEHHESGQVGCICPRAVGTPLDRQTYSALYLSPDGLRARLRVAQRLAESIHTLHRHCIVVADLNETNLLYDQLDGRAIVCDVDGGGVLASERGDAYLPGLAPLMRGRFEENFLAPEMLNGARAEPGPASDCWSLAAAIHKFLFGGLDPFFGMPYLEIVKLANRWPALLSQPGREKWSGFHRSELTRLGRTLQNRLRSVFDRQPGAGWHPNLRPRAGDWARDLRTAAAWIRRCHACGEEFVSEGAPRCPFCGASGHHYRIQTQYANFAVNQEGQMLAARHLGFADYEGRYAVADFHMQNGELWVTARQPLQVSTSKRWLAPTENCVLDSDAAVWSFVTRSRDGRARAVFRVSAPDRGLRPAGAD